jgi:hypothetical protein
MKKQYCPTIAEMTLDEIAQFGQITADVEHVIGKFIDAFPAGNPYSRKEMAAWIDQFFPYCSAYLFRYLSNKPYDDLIWRKVKKSPRPFKALELPSDDKIKFYYYNYFGKKNEKRYVTVAYSEKNNSIGISVCNPGDVYDKHIGKELALQRITEKPIIFNDKMRNVTHIAIHDFITAYLTIVNPKMFVWSY